MIQFERREQILAILKEKKSSSVRDLARALFTSEASIRRDIAVLERNGVVKSVYGGVLLADQKNGIIPVDLRDSEHSADKEELARRAAEYIHDGDTVIMDASSTVRRIMKYITNRKDVKIITNNLRIFSEYQGSDIKLYCTGGAYSQNNHAFIGPAAEAYLRTVCADSLFFSSQGISDDGEISDASEEETSLRKVMLTRAKKQYFLCDQSKIGIRQTFTLCSKDDITKIIFK